MIGLIEPVREGGSERAARTKKQPCFRADEHLAVLKILKCDGGGGVGENGRSRR